MNQPEVFGGHDSLTSVMVGEVAHVPRPRRGHPSFHRRVRLFAALDARQEILHVGNGAVAKAALRKNRVLPAFHALTINGEASCD